MNAVRGLALLKASRVLQGNAFLTKQIPFKTQIRKSHGETKWYYRQACEPDPKQSRKTVIIGSMVWWWILWHFFTEYEEFFGPHFPDPEKWTDEELGIPPL